ncbi:MAG: prepilin-type N-terminal cleavage/methylation domain-containing protein [Candidatus Scalindua sp. AMX11]|nr:MAG: prepilin-type N-terminal cleavage/methylation domain-containing protein [Candidatus Scalindua sp.]NOG82431.1 prepilin-type N-terminal cleavage/methylation domain-containing protein [Planctomycetota bacterium]RZV70214.1 MAG: prepilin-type N-terminal cleavage/methylation domain-containing protein [Candidatus Scalindua sp. SCAELEC01]TDE64075.1 MAG: prepilin-type N-terminal cleavage/methylation domain-containing protein [Candidatus Scalindua sp. AMX11]GJQ60100.1 MAG: hypothetical protein SC
MMKKILLCGKNGFSLIEIMITMTIVAVLGGIATVAILKERSAFYQTACMSNLRQISQGMQIYYNENGKFPKDGYPDDGNDPLPLSTELANYVPEKSLFICPEDDDPVTTANFASYDPYYVARKDPDDVDKLLIGCPHHREAKKATNLLGAGTTNITNVDTVLVNGQEIPPDGTSAERVISNVNDEMTFVDGSRVKITNSQAGYGTYLVQSVRLADGTLYSIIRVEDEGTIDVQVTAGSKFEVVTPSAIIGVRGTRFTVQTLNANNATTVTMITGTVDVMDRETGTVIKLSIDGTTTATIDDLDDGVDNDGDGYTGNQGDCDDANPIVHPGAGEILDNGIDDDCNPATPDSSQDIDSDGDGFTGNQGDCDDGNPNVNPGVAEIADNGIDDDCNPATPDSSSDIDNDGDGFTENQGDCDDADPAINPGATEVFDGVDNNCDGQTDEGFTDTDGDGYTLEVDDCNDADPAINPGATEVFDGVDNNCDGQTDEGFTDADGDGYTLEVDDCNDADASINPGAAEVFDGVDNNCDGQTDEGFTDADGDGFALEVDDCDDTNPNVNSGMAEIADNGIDDDCNPATPDSSSGDQALIDFINNPANSSTAVANYLVSESPLSDAVLIAMINRSPSLSSGDNENILNLASNNPLSDNVLIAAINEGTIMNSFEWTMQNNSPLSENVLNSMINNDTLMTSREYKDILVLNSPLPLNILGQVIAGTPSLKTNDLTKVLAANGM